MNDTTPLYNWLDSRQSGLLLHLSSLPSQTGIGNLGAAAYEVVDFLRDSGIKIWQLCPLGPTGYGDSPYQCFSAFAGNPYFIDLEPLLDSGPIEDAELDSLRGLSKPRLNTDSSTKTSGRSFSMRSSVFPPLVPMKSPTTEVFQSFAKSNPLGLMTTRDSWH